MLQEDRVTTFQAWVPTGRKVLVLAPHPDDETIGCGGTLRLHTMSGDPVKVVFLTNGSQGDVRKRHSKPDYVARRSEEARKACELLGINDLQFWQHEDRQVAATTEIADQVAAVIADYRPDLVYTPSPFEIHPDHRATCEWLRRVLKKLPHPPDVAYCEVSQPLVVNRLVDISPVIDTKTAALRSYRTQLRERPYDRVSLGLNRFRTLTLYPTADYAEGFLFMDGVTAARVSPHVVSLMLASRYAVEAGVEDDDAPLVSLCLTIDRMEHTLPAVFQAIAAQTHPRLEVCIVNRSGSDPESMARLLLGPIPWKIVAADPDTGPLPVMRTGLAHTGGSYVAFIHDRCLLQADHLQCLLDTCDERNPSFSFSGSREPGSPPALDACLFERRFIQHRLDRLDSSATANQVMQELFEAGSPRARSHETIDYLCHTGS